MANKLQKESQDMASGEQDDKLLLTMKSAFPLPSHLPEKSRLYEALLAGAAGYWDETPIFVVGMPRSGSTLIEQIIASHPGAEGAGLFASPSKKIRYTSHAALIKMNMSAAK